ncbi:MAG: DUF4239 domain-containing protein [Isosphaeraceae bacterium]|nr:DUF4239 domain-containing protein [Isosphaeraceae bacterium]
MRIDSYISGVFLVSGSAAIAVLGLVVAHRLIDHRHLRATHAVAGNFLSVVGTLYAVLLGLIVIDAMGTFQRGLTATEQEANALADLYLLADQLPSAEAHEIQHLCSAYVNLVIDREWPALERGHDDPKTRAAAIALMKAILTYEPRTESEKAIYATELEAASQFWSSRRSRTLVCSHGIPALEWFVLLAGGITTVAITYFFFLDNFRLQAVLTAMVAVIIALNIFLVLMFGYPFSGDLQVRPDSFCIALEVFQAAH